MNTKKDPQENLSKAYLDIERKIINLMLRHTDVIAELVENNINPDYFSERHQSLVQAIFYTHGISDGKRLLTDNHFRSLVIEQGGKGDITIAMQTHFECLYGVHHSNSKDDFDLLKRQLVDSYVHRHGIECLDKFNKSVGTLGYVDATRIYADELASVTRSANPRFRLVTFDKIEREKVVYLWGQKIPIGMLTIFGGVQGEGKSAITLDISARVTTGEPMPGTSCPTPKGSVIVANCEDPEHSVIRNRLDGIETIDLSKLAYLEQTAELIDLDKNLRELEEMILSLGDCKLLILDPISAYMGEVNTHEDAQVRRVLGPVCKLAAKMDVAIVGIMHLSKDKTKGVLQRILGSTAFTATARSVFMVGKDRDGRKLFSHIKSNVSELTGSLEYDIVGNNDSIRVKWENTVIYEDPEDLFSARRPIEDAQEWLSGELKDGPQDSKLIFNKAETKGFSAKTLKRAKKLMGIETKKKGLNSGWEMSL